MSDVWTIGTIHRKNLRVEVGAAAAGGLGYFVLACLGRLAIDHAPIRDRALIILRIDIPLTFRWWGEVREGGVG